MRVASRFPLHVLTQHFERHALWYPEPNDVRQFYHFAWPSSAQQPEDDEQACLVRSLVALRAGR
jgi:hypothetical protein